MYNSDIKPLAERMRPRRIEEFVGQKHLLGKGKILTSFLDKGILPSIIFWGPPGCGKTTLARILAQAIDARFISISAVLSGVKELRNVIDEAKLVQKDSHIKTVLFVDEIHRFNKAQQDAFLPHVESGLITLIGATTENPSFEIISPLLSRCKLLTLRPLNKDELLEILKRALSDKERGLGAYDISISSEAEEMLISISDGDARRLLNLLETSIALGLSDGGKIIVDIQTIVEAAGKKLPRYDKSGDEHFGLISAFHKSLRGSDPDAALYWLSRMLHAGEDPKYIARRMVRFASEDIGNADPTALTVALNALDAFNFLGSPEGELALAQAAIYLATAPKSNAIYKAFSMAMEDVERFGTLEVPKHILNAPTRLMKELGYSKGYKYPHKYQDALVPQQYMPDKLVSRRYYEPTTRGYENTIKIRLDKWRKILAKRRKGKGDS